MNTLIGSALIICLLSISVKAFDYTWTFNSVSEGRFFNKAAQELQAGKDDGIRDLILAWLPIDPLIMGEFLGILCLFLNKDKVAATEYFRTSKSNISLYFLSFLSVREDEKRECRKQLMQIMLHFFRGSDWPVSFAIDASWPDYDLRLCFNYFSDAQQRISRSPTSLLLGECNFFTHALDDPSKKLSLFVGINGLYERLVPSLIIRSVASTSRLRLLSWLALRTARDCHGVNETTRKLANAYLALIYYYDGERSKAFNCLTECRDIWHTFVFPLVLLAEPYVLFRELNYEEYDGYNRLYGFVSKSDLILPLKIHSLIRLGQLMEKRSNYEIAQAYFAKAFIEARQKKLGLDWERWALLHFMWVRARFLRYDHENSASKRADPEESKSYYTGDENILALALKAAQTSVRKSVDYYGVLYLTSKRTTKIAVMAQILGHARYKKEFSASKFFEDMDKISYPLDIPDYSRL